MRWLNMTLIEKVVRKVNRRTIAIASIGVVVGALVITMSIGSTWSMPISIGFMSEYRIFEEVHVVLIGTKLLQKIIRS
jgi:hypothetical protein